MIAIDLGSNTLRVLRYDCATGEHLGEYEKVVKTADGLAQHGTIGEEAIARVISAIQEAQEVMDFSSARVKAVTTEALRRAANAEEVLSRIKRETGIAFEVISGDTEARLTLMGAKHRLSKLHYASDTFVLIDIGGGSTELIFHYPDEMIAKSFPVGIVTIAQTYKDLENIENALPEVMLDMQMFCAEVYATRGKVHSFVATSGTPTTVSAMKLGQTYATYDASKINGTVLQVSELDFFLKKLLSLPFDERERAVGTGRSDLIAAGILIYKHLYKLLAFESCVVIDDGLREGLALEACK
ncbi:MAG TPA: phosphatase [Sulfurovum sp.]|uniref:Ppx/GppA phosphatase family protein n=1 Tax=Sulfurovum sp. TaxID=1969726 RepID=UPI002F928096